jgi:hypothetical protein
MKIARVWLSILAVGTLFGVSQALAQEPAMPKPGPEMERVRFLVGTWDLKGEYAKSAMSPQGEK